MSVSDPLPGKHPLLPPTPNLSEYEFEDFTERLLSANRFSPGPARRVIRVERWGRRGDAQDGIDFEGEYSDGKTAAWQCKRYDKLTPADVREIVRVCTFSADVYYLVFSGEASRDVRNEIKKHSKWQLLDQRAGNRPAGATSWHLERDPGLRHKESGPELGGGEAVEQAGQTVRASAAVHPTLHRAPDQHAGASGYAYSSISR